MERSQRALKFFLMSIVSVVLSLLTLIMGAPMIIAIRKAFGSLSFWMLGLILVGSFYLLQTPLLSLLLGSIWMTLGVYAELEERKMAMNKASFVAISSGSIFLLIGSWIEVKRTSIDLLAESVKVASEFVKRIQQVNPGTQIEPLELAQQIPSAVIVILVTCLGVGLIFEKKVFTWFTLPREKANFQKNLLEFRLPDFALWITMFSALLTMVNGGIKELEILAMNILNVAVILYLFQGLAVLEVLLRKIHAGFLTRFLSYLIFVGQMPLLLSAFGFIDFWVDFRRRFRSWKSAEGS